MGILRIRFVRNLILIGLGTACIGVDGAFLDLFPSVIFYLTLEYLWFESSVDPIRVMIVLTLHSITCFANLNVTYVVILVLYMLSLLWRDYFLKTFVPFVLYSTSLYVTFVMMGTHWIGTAIVSLLSLMFWRVKLEEV